VAAAAALLLLGAALGAAGMYPLARGQVALPTWIPFAASLYATTPAASPTAQPTATIAPSGPVLVGDLLVATSACGVTPVTLTLRNTGAVPVQWAVGALDAPGASFAFSSGSAHSALAGTLAPGATVMLAVAGLPAGGARAVVIASAGATELLVGAC
jgi:hypothetical protein